MALDGAFLRHIKNEIESLAIGARVDKIHQPSKEEFIFSMRNRSGAYKLLMSTRANSSRVHFTKDIPENPSVPPMLCMLFRKKLCGAKLIGIRQPSLERVLFFDFEATNELGDKVLLTVVAEIMGKYSNIILVDQNGKIIDALKRVDFLVSSKRQVVPFIKYELPPNQNKLSLLDNTVDEIVEQIIKLKCSKSLSQVLLETVQGISPIVCSEIEYRIKFNKDISLKDELNNLINVIKTCSGSPTIVYDKVRPKDFSFFNITQYEDTLSVEKYKSFSELLDAFFIKRDRIDRMKAKSHDLYRQVNNILSRLRKKVKIQKTEIEQSENKDNLRVFADLINANLYQIEKGANEVILQNFYDENLKEVKIKLDPMLSAAKNAQKFYKEYRKSKIAREVLSSEIDKANKEITYMESVLDSINRAQAENDLSEIKNELISQGYIKEKKLSNKKQIALPPIEYNLDENIKVLVGRNNHQNDKLTLKIASKRDIWFHVKDMPGSHTILFADKNFITEDILNKVAQIAAYHSRAKDSSNVPVDYAMVKDVKKPSGSKPGMVIYDNYKTLYVTPDRNFIENLSK